ncbi:MAG: hypothetical protein RMJ46_07455 [Bacteroidota bacterium]|nr:hypothetical protein [Bacteroidota bacterium]
MWLSAAANGLSSLSFLVAYLLSGNFWLLVPSGIFAVAGAALFLVWSRLGHRLSNSE